ncbi:MAG: YtxH domain-containing protein [Pelolinea sp.]|jgi:gas vesicle protein|nr:YtxH domain-containing protein [Pelolinea sp.]
MSDHDNFGSFFSGFLFGGIAGAVVALLLAPQSGEETRKLVKEKSIELSNKATHYADEVFTQTEKTVGEVATKTTEFIDTTIQKASEVSEKGQVILESKKEKAPAPKKKTKAE